MKNSSKIEKFIKIRQNYQNSSKIFLADVWSIGCILSEILTGNPLFLGYNYYLQMIAIIKTLKLTLKEFPEKMKSCFLSFQPDLLQGKYELNEIFESSKVDNVWKELFPDELFPYDVDGSIKKTNCNCFKFSTKDFQKEQGKKSIILCNYHLFS